MERRAAQAAIHVLRREGVTADFGVPGTGINPAYAVMYLIGGINHTLARRAEGER